MRLLLVTRDFPPQAKGGISTAVGGLAHAAAAAGHTVWVLSFDAWRPKAHPGGMPSLPAEAQHRGGATVRVRRLRAPHHVAAVVAEVAAFRPHVVQVHHGMLWRPAQEICADLGAWRPRWWLSAHVIQAEMNRLRGVAHTLSATAQAEALAAADRVHVPSSAAAAVLLGHHPEVAARLVVVPLGWGPFTTLPSPERCIASGKPGKSSDSQVDSTPPPEPVPASAEPPAEASPSPKLRRGQPRLRLVTVSRFDHTKGTADLVEAVPQLLALAPEVEIRVVGGVPDNRKAERRWRERLLVAGGARIHVLGWLGPAEVAQELAAATVAWFPSHAETYGLAVLEAMAAGVAVVATDVPGHRALLAPEGASPAAVLEPASIPEPAGVLVPVGDPAALAAAAASLLDDSDRAAALGAAARQAAQSLTWAALWPMWEALLAES